VAAEDDAGPVMRHPREWTGQPGSRAPHVVLERDGRRLSTLDLYGRRFVLLTDAAGEGWRRAAEQVAPRLGMELDVLRVGGDLADVDGRWHDAHGIGAGGAVLVRPDGFWPGDAASICGLVEAAWDAPTTQRAAHARVSVS